MKNLRSNRTIWWMIVGSLLVVKVIAQLNILSY